MRKRTAKKLLDRCALEFCLGGYSRYTVPEHLACRAAVRLPGHPFVRLMVATDALVFGDDDRHDLDPTDDDDSDWSYVSLDDDDRDDDDDLIVVADGHPADVLIDVLRPAARKAGGSS